MRIPKIKLGSAQKINFFLKSVGTWLKGAFHSLQKARSQRKPADSEKILSKVIVAYPGQKEGLPRQKLPLILIFSHIQAVVFNGILTAFIATTCWTAYLSLSGSIRFIFLKVGIFLILLALVSFLLWLARGMGASLAVWANVPLDDREWALFLSPKSYMADMPFPKANIRANPISVLWGKRGEITLEMQLAVANFISRFSFLAMFLLLGYGVRSGQQSSHSPVLTGLLAYFLLFVSIVFNTYAANIRGLMTKINSSISRACSFLLLPMVALFLVGLAVGLNLMPGYKYILYAEAILAFWDLLFAALKGIGTYRTAPDHRFYWIGTFYRVMNDIQIIYSKVAYELTLLGVALFAIFTIGLVPGRQPTLHPLSVAYLGMSAVFISSFVFLGGVWKGLCETLGGSKIAYLALRGLFYVSLIFLGRQAMVQYGVMRPFGFWDIYMLGVWMTLSGLFTAALAHAVKSFYVPYLRGQPFESERMGARRWFDLSMSIFPRYPFPSGEQLWADVKDWAIMLFALIVVYILKHLLAAQGKFHDFSLFPVVYLLMVLFPLRNMLVMPDQNMSKFISLGFQTKGPNFAEHCFVAMVWMEGATGLFWGYEYAYNFLSWRLF